MRKGKITEREEKEEGGKELHLYSLETTTRGGGKPHNEVAKLLPGGEEENLPLSGSLTVKMCAFLKSSLNFEFE